jgi:hypothetical protein
MQNSDNNGHYDREQPGYEMLQAGSDLVVGGTGAFMMGGSIRNGAPQAEWEGS